MGVPRLDEMLGGGLPRGYSVLVAGPSGSGKSILAAAFLAEGARCGETGVMAAFEQHPNRSRNRSLDRADRQRQGGRDRQPRRPDLSIDEIVLLLMTRGRAARGPSRVVIDSLVGLRTALAPTFREDFRESLLAAGRRPGAHGRHRADDLGTRRPLHRPALQPLRRRLPDRRDHRAALHRGRQPADARDGGRQGAGQRPLGPAARCSASTTTASSIGEMLPDQEGLLGGRPTQKFSADAPALAARTHRV